MDFLNTIMLSQSDAITSTASTILRLMATISARLIYHATLAAPPGVVVALVIISTPPAIANPYTLKCTTEYGDPAVDLTVDLDRRVMTWGTKDYTITNITDRYITAIENDALAGRNVGGEIWVLDRVTGDYKRAAVGMFCKEPPPCRTGTVLRAFTYFRRCVR